MTARPYLIARYGVYAALAVAVLSAWLGQRSGATLDYALMRSVLVFVALTAIAFGLEAMWSFGTLRPPVERRPQPVKEETPDE